VVSLNFNDVNFDGKMDMVLILSDLNDNG